MVLELHYCRKSHITVVRTVTMMQKILAYVVVYNVRRGYHLPEHNIPTSIFEEVMYFEWKQLSVDPRNHCADTGYDPSSSALVSPSSHRSENKLTNFTICRYKYKFLLNIHISN